MLIKALRCSWDVLELHIPVFLLQGCVVVLGCVASDVALSPWALRRVVAGGLCYACGLIPWAASWKEFHNAAWHAFVLLGSACMFTTHLLRGRATRLIPIPPVRYREATQTTPPLLAV